MRILSPLIVVSAILATPALADCPDQRMVFQPTSGKLGFRMEILQADAGAKALVHRPFRSTPDTYQIVSEQTADAGTRYVLIGPAGTLQLDVDADGIAVVEANREIPSRWRLVCEQPKPIQR
jgi:hypothetical protein